MSKLYGSNSVLYGYPTLPLMKDIVNLALTYDGIYDYEEMLDPLRANAKALSRHFTGDRLSSEDVKGWDLDTNFLVIFSISDYYGFDLKNLLGSDSRLIKRVLWLDEAKSTRKADCEGFIKLIDDCFKVLLENAPNVAEKVIYTLSELHRLFDEGLIISRETILPEIMKAREAVTFDMIEAAVVSDLEDKVFLSLISEIYEKTEPWWVSFTINAQLLESSYLEIPLHLWDIDLPLVKYKYERGARFLPKLTKEEIIQQAFSVLIPQVYALDIADLLEIRNNSEFRNFRKEVSKIFKEALEAPQEISDANSIRTYLEGKYFSQLEGLALQRRPKPGTVLLKKLVSNVHPIVGLVVGGKELYEEYRDKYRQWRLALSVLEAKDKVRAFLKRREHLSNFV